MKEILKESDYNKIVFSILKNPSKSTLNTQCYCQVFSFTCRITMKRTPAKVDFRGNVWMTQLPQVACISVTLFSFGEVLSKLNMCFLKLSWYLMVLYFEVGKKTFLMSVIYK